MSMSRSRGRRILGMVLLAAAAMAAAGCEGEAGVPRDGSPIVDTSSEKFRTAQAEAQKKLADDAAAEAKAKSRFHGPAPE